MTTFDDREQAFEKKYAHDAEMQFKADARRNKKLAIWAADKLGLDDASTQLYIGDVISADLAEPGDEDVFRKVFGDFTKNGVSVAEEELRAKMATLMHEAKAEILAED